MGTILVRWYLELAFLKKDKKTAGTVGGVGELYMVRHERKTSRRCRRNNVGKKGLEEKGTPCRFWRGKQQIPIVIQDKSQKRGEGRGTGGEDCSRYRPAISLGVHPGKKRNREKRRAEAGTLERRTNKRERPISMPRLKKRGDVLFLRGGKEGDRKGFSDW